MLAEYIGSYRIQVKRNIRFELVLWCKDMERPQIERERIMRFGPDNSISQFNYCFVTRDCKVWISYNLQVFLAFKFRLGWCIEHIIDLL